MPIKKLAFATRPKYPQFFHTSFQKIIGFCRGGDFRDG